jgi:hypothetical protein
VIDGDFHSIAGRRQDLRQWQQEARMRVTIELREDIANESAGDLPELSRAPLEALAIEGVRSGKLSTGQAHRMLGYQTRVQVDAFLKAHGALLPLTTPSVKCGADLSRTFREQWRSS